MSFPDFAGRCLQLHIQLYDVQAHLTNRDTKREIRNSGGAVKGFERKS